MNKKSNAKLLIFDLDGTLIDTMGDYADKAAILILKHYGTPKEEARRLYFQTSGLPFELQLEQLFPKNRRNAEVAMMFESWKDGYLTDLSLPSKTRRLLEQWREKGFRIAISSNNLEPYVQRLAACWPVDAALGYRPQDGFAKGKPHFQKLKSLFEFPRREMLFIGDSPNDARIASQYGVAFCGLLSEEFSESDFFRHSSNIQCLEDLEELNKYL